MPDLKSKSIAESNIDLLLVFCLLLHRLEDCNLRLVSNLTACLKRFLEKQLVVRRACHQINDQLVIYGDGTLGSFIQAILVEAGLAA